MITGAAPGPLPPQPRTVNPPALRKGNPDGPKDVAKLLIGHGEVVQDIMVLKYFPGN